MKWFKHYTDSLDDPFIQTLMDRFSHAGYAAWFGLIEIIAKENGNNVTGDLIVKPIYLKRKLRISTTKLQQIFDFCATNGKLSFNFSKEKWSFKFPKIAEIKDNYTKDLQGSGKKLSNHKEEEKEVYKEKKERNKERKDTVTPSKYKESYYKTEARRYATTFKDREEIPEHIKKAGARPCDCMGTIPSHKNCGSIG
jgi:hypothetical protein